MKKYSYNLFPKPFAAFGYVLIVIAITGVIISLFTLHTEKPFNSFAASFSLLFIGSIMALFRVKLIIEDKPYVVIKKSGIFCMDFSSEAVRIPENCTGIIIKGKMKKGTGYYRFVLPVSYYFKSFDMFFRSEKGLVRLINTDYYRAIKIAGFFKSAAGFEYILEE